MPTSAAAHTAQPGLLRACLLGAGAISLLFYAVGHPGYAHEANLLATAVYWLLALLVPLRRAYTLLCQLALLNSVLLMGYIASRTGGINSPALVWMTVLAVPALLMLGRRWAQRWVLLSLLVLLGQWLAVRQGWVAGEVLHTPLTLAWASMNLLLLMFGLVLAVQVYERLHRRQREAIEHSNAELEAAQQALLQTQSHKDEFLASVGHELRTPMNAILGLNGVLQTELADRPEQRALAEHIRASTEQLLGLVNDILDFSQLEAGRLQLLAQPLVLRPWLQAQLAPWQARAQAKGLTLHGEVAPELPPALLVDAQRLRQLLVNLLDNAIKFTPSGSITVRVSAQPGPGWLRLAVQDSGPGIAAERLPHIFNRFEHADLQTARRYGGTGLGLAICEQLVKLHRGRIGVESEPGQGALFWFELPLAAVDAESRTAMPPVPAPAAARRLLLVDDNAVNLMVARLVLQKNWPDAQVDTCTDAEQALALLERERCDAVFMDMVMPGTDGPQATRRLRQHPRPELARLPVIGLTANHNAHDRQLCLQAGMDEVLAKPLDAEAVREALERLLAQRAATPASNPGGTA